MVQLSLRKMLTLAMSIVYCASGTVVRHKGTVCYAGSSVWKSNKTVSDLQTSLHDDPWTLIDDDNPLFTAHRLPHGIRLARCGNVPRKQWEPHVEEHGGPER